MCYLVACHRWLLVLWRIQEPGAANCHMLYWGTKSIEAYWTSDIEDHEFPHTICIVLRGRTLDRSLHLRRCWPDLSIGSAFMCFRSFPWLTPWCVYICTGLSPPSSTTQVHCCMWDFTTEECVTRRRLLPWHLATLYARFYRHELL